MKRFKKYFIILLFIINFNNPSIAKSEVIDVAFCIDNNYPLYTMIAINSILLNNRSNSKYNFYIVENNISLWNKLQMIIFVKSRKQNIEFIKVNTNAIDNGKNLFIDTKYSFTVTRIGTARILIPKLLPNLHKILYLDSDILVTDDLLELYKTDISKYYAGMASNYLDIYIQENYYNSGVILMNLDLWRKDNVTEKCIKILQEKKLTFPDQDVINTVLENKIKKISFNWNNQNRSIKFNKGIDHYTGEVKPWNILGRYKLYDDYWNKSYLVLYKIFYLPNFYYELKMNYASKIYSELVFPIQNRNN